MKTIRQIYTYLTTLISLEVVIWGTIRLTRTIANPRIQNNADHLAGALALMVVGLPIFWFHWQFAQKDAHESGEGRDSLIRALFFYAALLSTFIPLINNALALINRLLLRAFQLPPSQAVIGGRQIWSDNLIAVVINALLWTYIYFTVREDWARTSSPTRLRNVRRLYRYVLLFYSLGFLTGGLHEIIRYLLGFPNTVGRTALQWLANGLALLLIGTPFWLTTWRTIQDAFERRTEHSILTRQISLFLLSLISALGTLGFGGYALNIVLVTLLGKGQTVTTLLAELSQPLAFAVPMAGIWAYYGNHFQRMFERDETLKRGESAWKLYHYLLAGFGIAAVLFSLQMLIHVIIDAFMNSAVLWGPSLRNRLSASLSSLAASLPLWLITWLRINREAAREGAPGDFAQRSLIRKTYLYLMLFGGIIGGMISGGHAAFLLFKSLLGLPVPDLWPDVFFRLGLLVLFTGLFLYHLRIQRRDTEHIHRQLTKRHAQYPVVILAEEDGDFASHLMAAIQQETPSLPVSVHSPEEGPPPEEIAQSKAIILSGTTALETQPVIQAWLDEFAERKVVVPTDAGGWQWVRGSELTESTLAKHTAHFVRGLAEGEEHPTLRVRSPLQTALTILGILFSLQLLLGVLAFLTSTLMD